MAAATLQLTIVTLNGQTMPFVVARDSLVLHLVERIFRLGLLEGAPLLQIGLTHQQTLLEMCKRIGDYGRICDGSVLCAMELAVAVDLGTVFCGLADLCASLAASRDLARKQLNEATTRIDRLENDLGELRYRPPRELPGAIQPSHKIDYRQLSQLHDPHYMERACIVCGVRGGGMHKCATCESLGRRTVCVCDLSQCRQIHKSDHKVGRIFDYDNEQYVDATIAGEAGKAPWRDHGLCD